MSGEVILVVDDSREIVKHLTEHLLPTFGYKTLHAFDGQSGLKLIHEKEPDLIMLDYNLPEMTGIDVLQQMAQEAISTPVILMTGYGSELSAIEAFRLGAKDYLIKPFTIDEIVETIDRALVETRLLLDKEELVEQLRRSKVEMSRLTHQMDTLSSIGKAITSLLSVDKILERVLEVATYLTNAEESTIWLPDSTGAQLEAYAKKNGDKDAAALPQLSMMNSQVGQVMRTGNSLRQSRFSGRGVKVETGYFARAVLYVPLKLRSVTLGVLGVINPAALRSFSKRDEFLLSFLADYAAIALENARVFQAADLALAARLDELNTLIEITRTITSSLDLDEVVRMTIQQVHNSWNIEASSVWWVEEKRQSLKVLANVGTPADILTQLSVPIGEGFVGHVAKTGKWIYTNDVANHPLHYRHVDDRTGFRTHVLLCVPLLFRGEVVGVMQLLNKFGRGFDDQDVERALSIATAVAIAVTNALLFKEAESGKQHLAASLEHNNSPMLIVDANDKLLLLNQEARTRLALTQEAIGRPVIEVVRPLELATLLIQPVEQISEVQGELILPDNSVWLPRVAPIPDHGRILILQDIMKLKRLEQAKDNFVAAVSHDMRAPLNTISGFVAGIKDTGPLNKEQELFLERISSATKHMQNLVDGLLELAQVSTHLEQKYQPCDMWKIVTEVVHDMQRQAWTKQQNLVLTAEDEKGFVKGNPGQLRRAVGNLIDNAIKYSPEAQQIKVVISTDAQNILVQVKDRGIGIDDVDLSHIFDKFYRGIGNYKEVGSGLGLALVHSIATAHKGRVWAESRNSNGSTFSLQLPLVSSGKEHILA